MGEALEQKDWSEEVAVVKNASDEITAITDENYSVVADIGAEAMRLLNQLKDARLAETKPHRDKVTSINERYGKWQRVLEDVKARLGGMTQAYRKRKAEEREEKQRKLDELEAETKKKADELGIEPPPIREIAPPEPPKVMRGDFGGKAITRKVWHVEVLFPMKLLQAIINDELPADVVTINTSKIKSLAIGGFKFEPSKHGVLAEQREETTWRKS